MLFRSVVSRAGIGRLASGPQRRSRGAQAGGEAGGSREGGGRCGKCAGRSRVARAAAGSCRAEAQGTEGGRAEGERGEARRRRRSEAACDVEEGLLFQKLKAIKLINLNLNLGFVLLVV